MKYHLPLLLLVACIAGILSVATMLRTPPLTFSNTQTWDETLLPYLSEAKHPESQYYLTNISIPPPPQNHSTETREELQLLHEHVAERTEEVLEDIEAERLSFNNFVFADFHVGSTEKPNTQALITDAHEKIIPVILAFKEKFDRVRPSVLDETLLPAIEVPGHPAYPSGHSTEAHLVAYILAFLDPNQSESYMNDAYRIAHNREIAGVHYKSDSEAGKEIARQFFLLYQQTLEGQAYIEAAHTEWGS